MNKITDIKNDQVIQQLIEGYQRFHEKYFQAGETQLFQELVKSQSPKTMIIACSDSRVDPTTILNCAPGEIFTVRNVANLVPPCEEDTKHHGTSAALEFAVCFLQVEHIIVLAHSDCGGIRALLNGSSKQTATRGFISSWMGLAEKAKEKALLEDHTPLVQEKLCCEYSLIASLDNLYSFPWIAERVEKAHLALHAWYFDLESGRVKCYNPNSEKFQNLI